MSNRDLELLHTKMSDLPEFEDKDDKPLLNSVGVINKIVRAFASDVINHAFSGDMSRNQFVAWAERRTKKLGWLFLGVFTDESAKYRIGVWNRPENLGHHVLLEMGMSGNCSEAVSILFVNLAQDIIKTMREHEGKGEESVKPALDALCARTRDILLGAALTE